MEIEMIKCPRCGQPFPKARKDLGYNYCVNCSTERPVVGLIEGTGPEGDSMDSITIMKPELAFKIERARRGISRSICISPDEEAPDMRTTEDQEDTIISSFDRETRIAGMEEEYATSVEEIKDLGSVLDDLEESEGEEKPELEEEDGMDEGEAGR